MSDLPDDLQQTITVLEAACTDVTRDLIAEYARVTTAFKRSGRNPLNFISGGALRTLAMAFGTFGTQSSRVRAMVQSDWNVTLDDLVEAFGPRPILSRDFVSELSRLCDTGKTWSEAKDSIGDARQKRLNRDGGRRGVSTSPEFTAMDVKDAAGWLNVSLRRKSKRASTVCPSRSTVF